MMRMKALDSLTNEGLGNSLMDEDKGGLQN